MSLEKLCLPYLQETRNQTIMQSNKPHKNAYHSKSLNTEFITEFYNRKKNIN